MHLHLQTSCPNSDSNSLLKITRSLCSLSPPLTGHTTPVTHNKNALTLWFDRDHQRERERESGGRANLSERELGNNLSPRLKKTILSHSSVAGSVEKPLSNKLLVTQPFPERIQNCKMKKTLSRKCHQYHDRLFDCESQLTFKTDCNAFTADLGSNAI